MMATPERRARQGKDSDIREMGRARQGRRHQRDGQGKARTAKPERRARHGKDGDTRETDKARTATPVRRARQGQRHQRDGQGKDGGTRETGKARTATPERRVRQGKDGDTRETGKASQGRGLTDVRGVALYRHHHHHQDGHSETRGRGATEAPPLSPGRSLRDEGAWRCTGRRLRVEGAGCHIGPSLGHGHHVPRMEAT